MRSIFSAQLLAVLSLFTFSCHQGVKTVDHRTKSKQSGEAREQIASLRGSEYQRDLAAFAGSNADRSDDPAQAPAPADHLGDRTYDVKKYELSGRFDWNDLKLIARVDISLDLVDQSIDELVLDDKTTRVRDIAINHSQHPGFTADKSQSLLRIDISGLTPEQKAAPLVVSIDYETSTIEPSDTTNAFRTESLRAILPRNGDPIAVRTLNTFSEPRGASRWMPCHDDPADRALFASTFTLPAHETFIANGHLLVDRVDERGTRTMSYATDYTIPTYLMAFAQGEFVSATSRVGSLPVTVYARRGLPIDFNSILQHLTATIARYQQLIGPYGFEKYAIVFLPEFGGGEEHAGITFQTELWGTDVKTGGDRAMTAHELAHQWFGDYMTVATWDDLWIKEGMATLMSSESTRPYSDYQNSGRLFGGHFYPSAGEAVVDPAVPPQSKYNSGPYDRAAWVLTQMRSLVGSDRFFEILRGVLYDHRYGNITTDEFLAAFANDISADKIAKIRQAIVAHAIPSIEVTENASGPAGLEWQVRVTDAEQSLIVPIEVSLFKRQGAVQRVLLDGTSEPITVREADIALASFDLGDKHAVDSLISEDHIAEYKRFITSKTSANVRTFAGLSPSGQLAWISSDAALITDADSYAALKSGAGDEEVKASLLAAACKRTAALTDADASVRDHLRQAISHDVLSLPYVGLTSWFTQVSIADCGVALGANPYQFALSQMGAFPETLSESPSEVAAIADLSKSLTDDGLVTIGAIALRGPSPRHRAVATQAILNKYVLIGSFPIDAAPTDQLLRLRSFFRGLLRANFTPEVLRYAGRAPIILNDIDSWTDYLNIIQSVKYAPQQISQICNVRKLTETHPDIWTQFIQAASQQIRGGSSVSLALQSPETVCR